MDITSGDMWYLNMYVRFETYDVSNHNMQALQGFQLGVIGKWGDERKGYVLVWGSMG